MLSLEFILTKFKLFFNCYFSSKIGLPQSNVLTNTSSGSFVDLGEMLFKLLLSFFSIRIFFHGHWRLTGQQGKAGDHLLFHSTTSTRSRTVRHLFATLHVRWLSHILNRIACIYQAATRWDLPPYRITIWLIDDVTLVFVCLRDDLILAFLLQQFETGTRGLELESTITLVLQGNRLTFRCDECCSSCFHKCYITTIFNNSSAERHECHILLYLLFVFRHKLTH